MLNEGQQTDSDGALHQRALGVEEAAEAASTAPPSTTKATGIVAASATPPPSTATTAFIASICSVAAAAASGLVRPRGAACGLERHSSRRGLHRVHSDVYAQQRRKEVCFGQRLQFQKSTRTKGV